MQRVREKNCELQKRGREGKLEQDGESETRERERLNKKGVDNGRNKKKVLLLLTHEQETIDEEELLLLNFALDEEQR